MSKKMEKLEPCPFCGSGNVAFTPDEEQQLEDTTTGFIWCHGCGFSSDSFYSKEIAAEHWNRRAATDANDPLMLDSRLTPKTVTCPKGWKGIRDTRFYCPGCKKAVRKGEAYCHKCGQALIFPVERYDKENNRIWLDFSDHRPPESKEE